MSAPVVSPPPSVAPPVVTPFLSQKFRFWSFVAMLLLVYVHGYNLHQRYLHPWSTLPEPHTITTYTEFFLAHGLFRFRIPILFAISGYLFALGDHKPTGERVRKRLRTLGLPYLLWSALALAGTWLLELSATGRAVVASSHLAQTSEHVLLVHQYGWADWLGRWLLAPVAFQLWFIRVLLVYNLAYPWLRAAVTSRGAPVYFLLTGLLWLGEINALLIEGEGLLFFGLGIWLAKRGYDVQQPPRWLHVRLLAVLWLGTIALKTWLAYPPHQLPGGLNAQWALPLLYKFDVAAGMLVAWFGGDWLVRACMGRGWFRWVAGFSFMVYALHVPAINYLTDWLFPRLHAWPYHRLAIFLVLPLLVSALAVGIGATLRALAPRFYGVLTGGRGLA